MALEDTEILKPEPAVGKYCTILFELPGWQYLAVAIVALSATLLALMRIESFTLLLNVAVLYLLLEAYAKTHAETVFHKIKRRAGLALAVLVYTTILLVATRSNAFSVASSTALVAVVVLGLDGTSVQRYLFVVTPPMITLAASRLLGFYTNKELLVGTMIVFALVLISLGLHASLSRWRVNKYSYLELGTLFFRNWLDKRTEIESAFEELGEYQYVNPRVIELDDLALIYTDVHYGPFSNVGSSRLPGLLSEAFKKLGFKNVVALHGLGSHDRNIVSAKYVHEYLEHLTKAYIGNEKARLLYHGAFAVENEEWRVLGVVFDKLSLLLVSRPRRGIDDLPYSLQLSYEIKAKSAGLGDVVIVDAHNWELQDKPNLSKLKAALESSLGEIAMLRSRSPVEVYHKYKCFEASAPGIIGKEACVICLAGEGRESVCIAYLRGNNMKPGVRDVLLREMSALKVNYVEVLTNDEHSETGVRPRVAYVPIHESPELVNAIRKAVVELRETPFRKSAWLYVSRANLKLMGESVNEIKTEMGSLGKRMAVAFSIYVFVAPMVLALVAQQLINSL